MTRPVFVVVGGNWGYDDQSFHGDDGPVKAFTDRAAAEAYQARCELRDQADPDLRACGHSEYTIVEMEVPWPGAG